MLKSPITASLAWDYKVEVGYEKNYDWFPIQEVLQSAVTDITLTATDIAAAGKLWTTNPPTLTARTSKTINTSTIIVPSL